MTQAVEEPQLVGDDWRPSTLEDAGAAELGARIEAATPVVVARRVLEGRCGLQARELWELGVRTVPAGALSTGGGVLLRVVMVAAIAAMAGSLGIAAAGIADLDDPDSRLGAGRIALVLAFVFAAHALFRVAWGAAGRERRRRLDRRRVAAEAVAPLLDPNGRLTVAILDGPGVLRVLLLWLRGHPRDADLLEARVVTERRVPRDEPSRAEDAVTALSEVAMLATRERTDPLDADAGPVRGARLPLPAVGAAATSRLLASGHRTAATVRHRASPTDVGPDWQPDGTTEEGEAELARRLCEARPRRWSAELLAPLVVDHVSYADFPVLSLPASTEREPLARRPVWVTAPALVLIALLMTFVISASSAELGVELTVRAIFLGAACWVTWKAFKPQIVELPYRMERRPLLRLVDDAACDAAAPLESGLPGGHGAVVVVSAEQDERRMVALVHVRAVTDARDGTLEARVLAALLAVLGVVSVFTGGEDPLNYLAATTVLTTVTAALLACVRRWTSISANSAGLRAEGRRLVGGPLAGACRVAQALRPPGMRLIQTTAGRPDSGWNAARGNSARSAGPTSSGAAKAAVPARLKPRLGSPLACVVRRAESRARPLPAMSIVGCASWGLPVVIVAGADHGGAATAVAARVRGRPRPPLRGRAAHAGADAAGPCCRPPGRRPRRRPSARA